MPSFLPFLLVGGGIAVVTVAGGRKKSRFRSKYIEVARGCKSVTIGGRQMTDDLWKTEDPEIKDGIVEALQAFWIEELFPVIERVKPDMKDPSKGAMQLLRATFPSCTFTKKSLQNAMESMIKSGGKSTAGQTIVVKMGLYIIMFAGLVAYMVKDGSLPKEATDTVSQDALGGMDMDPGEFGWGDGSEIDPNMMAMKQPSALDLAAMTL